MKGLFGGRPHQEVTSDPSNYISAFQPAVFEGVGGWGGPSGSGRPTINSRPVGGLANSNMFHSGDGDSFSNYMDGE